MIKNLIHDYHYYRWHRTVTATVHDYCGPDIGPIIMSFLSPPFRCEDLSQSRHVIRQNCVAGILTLLKKSQELYDTDPIANGPCFFSQKMVLSLVDAIQLVVNYGPASFTQELDHEEVEQLGLC